MSSLIPDSFVFSEVAKAHNGNDVCALSVVDDYLASAAKNSIKIWEFKNNKFNCVKTIAKTNIESIKQINHELVACSNGKNIDVLHLKSFVSPFIEFSDYGKMTMSSFKKKDRNVFSIYKSSTNNRYPIVSFGEKTVDWFNFQDGEKYQLLKSSDSFTSALYTSHYFFVGTDEGKIKRMCADGNVLFDEIQAHEEMPIYAIIKVGRNFVSCSHDKSIKVWGWGFKWNIELKDHEGPVYDLCRIDKERFVSVSGDKTAKIWKIGDSEVQCKRTLRLDDGGKCGVFFKDHIVIGLDDGRIQVFE